MKKLFYTAGICIVLTVACSDEKPISNVLFVSPQPEETREFLTFPKYLLGEYCSARDSSRISIHPKGIYLHNNYPGNVSVMDLDSTYILIGDSLIRDMKSRIDFPVKRQGDTLYWTGEQTDTLFKFDENHVLKRYKNTWILNSRQEDGWLLAKLEKKNKQLTWSYIDSTEINQLKNLSDTYVDSIPFQFKISPSKFKEFISSHGFKDIDTFQFKAPVHKAFLK